MITYIKIDAQDVDQEVKYILINNKKFIFRWSGGYVFREAELNPGQTPRQRFLTCLRTARRNKRVLIDFHRYETLDELWTDFL